MITVEEVRADMLVGSTEKLCEYLQGRSYSRMNQDIADTLYGYACYVGNTEAMDILTEYGANNYSWSNINAASADVFNQSDRVKEKILNPKHERDISHD